MPHLADANHAPEPKAVAGGESRPDIDLLNRALAGESGDDQQLIAESGLALVVLLLRKNHDYGSSAFRSPEFCPQVSARDALLVRMSDKSARLANLQAIRSPEVAESIDDTVRDLGGYAILFGAARG